MPNAERGTRRAREARRGRRMHTPVYIAHSALCGDRSYNPPMPLRLLLLVAFIFVVWRLYRKLRAAAVAAPPPQEQFEPMAPCAQCGTYLPARALSRDGRCGACRG